MLYNVGVMCTVTIHTIFNKFKQTSILTGYKVKPLEENLNQTYTLSVVRDIFYVITQKNHFQK